MQLSLQLQWSSTNQWSPLLGRGQKYQACVITSGKDTHLCEDDEAVQTIVVFGEVVNTPIPSLKPNLNVKRGQLVAVVCHGIVYAIGRQDRNYLNQYLDTM